jgi:hypothetical protein
MGAFCTCTVDIISKSGFSMREGIAYCNHCSKPEVSSSTSTPIKAQKAGNLITDLFDFKIERFVSVAYFRLLYKISVVLWTIIAVVVLFLFWGNFSYLSGGLLFLLSLVIPVVYFLILIYTRMSIELIVNFFQIGKDIKSLREAD